MKRCRIWSRDTRLAVLLFLPSVIILVAVAFYPLGSVFVSSVYKKEFASAEPARFVGLAHYKKLLSICIRRLPKTESGYADPFDVLPLKPYRYRELGQFSFRGGRYVVGAADAEFIHALRDTLIFVTASVLIETILGLSIAMLLARTQPRMGNFRAAVLIPWAVPTAVSSRIWQWMLAPNRSGLFNMLAYRLGVSDGQTAFLTEPAWQLTALIAIDAWKTTPFIALICLAGRQAISNNLYEAAVVDGASPWRQFRTITLPLLFPSLMVAVTFRTLDALRVFDLFQIIYGQKRCSLASFVYYRLIADKQMGYSAAGSVILFTIILIFVVIYGQRMRRMRHE